MTNNDVIEARNSGKIPLKVLFDKSLECEKKTNNEPLFALCPYIKHL